MPSLPHTRSWSLSTNWPTQTLPVPGTRNGTRMSKNCSRHGIDVYTTLNVQHIESLNDVVAQITGVIMQEKIPDRVIDEAAEIEVVDLAPPELLQRLREGKVYVPDMAARAIEQFFNEGNLYALRELALRRAAERVDTQMLAYMQTRSIPGPWPVGEYLLVCIGPGPLAERLIRTARRQADRINARWCAIYVETPAHHRLSQKCKGAGRPVAPACRKTGGDNCKRVRAQRGKYRP